MMRIGKVSLVMLVVALAFSGFMLSADGVYSLTLAQEPVFQLVAGDGVLKVQGLGEIFCISKDSIVVVENELGRFWQGQAWRSMVQMGRALAEYTVLVY